MIKINVVFDKELLSYGFKYYHSINFADTPHIMTIGGTGSGKTYLNKLIIAKIALEDESAEVFVLDFKADDYSFGKGTKRLYEFDKCLEGLTDFYQILANRQLSVDLSRTFRLMVIEELGSILSHYDKKQADSIKAMIATIILMGRSFNIHVLVSTQRPDASYFASGVRDSIGAIIALGNLSKEGKSMLFKDYEDKMVPVSSLGAGYMLINGVDFKSVQVPNIKDTKEMERLIYNLLDR
jgi:hypothetical protein